MNEPVVDDSPRKRARKDPIPVPYHNPTRVVSRDGDPTFIHDTSILPTIPMVFRVRAYRACATTQGGGIEVCPLGKGARKKTLNTQRTRIIGFHGLRTRQVVTTAQCVDMINVPGMLVWLRLRTPVDTGSSIYALMHGMDIDKNTLWVTILHGPNRNLGRASSIKTCDIIAFIMGDTTIHYAVV